MAGRKKTSAERKTPGGAALSAPLVVGIYGSPRKGGNTDVLLDRALRGARNEGAAVEPVYLREKNIIPCRADGCCSKTGECVIDDDFATLEPLLTAADGIILATPVFFYAVTSLVKIMMDRCQLFWARKYVIQAAAGRTRPGALLAAGATNGTRLFDGVLLSVRYFFDAIDVRLSETLLVRGVDAKGEILKEAEHLDQAERIGQAIARAAASWRIT